VSYPVWLFANHMCHRTAVGFRSCPVDPRLAGYGYTMSLRIMPARETHVPFGVTRLG
jgi:hypothetical protein